MVASVYQTGLNLMRDLERRGVRAVGIDCFPEHEGFQSRYGKSYLCPNPDTEPEAWVAFMIELARSFGTRPVIIPAADQFVTAIGRHAAVLQEHYIFSMESVAVQAAFATKEQQYALVAKSELPIPRTVYVQCRADMEAFVATARFPCLIKPRHQREWDVLPAGNPLRGRKLITAETAEEMLELYTHTEALRPEVMAQEIIAGGDDAKYCYLSVYGRGTRRLGHCVARELRAYPVGFGSGSLVEPMPDAEVDRLCDAFLRSVNYVGICEIEVKRDTRDGVVRLIEANPRFSITADAAVHAGVDIGWLHYLDLIGEEPEEVGATRYGFRHVVLRREVPTLPRYVAKGVLTWGDIWRSYRGELEFFDFDRRDPRPTLTTMKWCVRVVVGEMLRKVGLLRKLPAN